MEYILDMCLSSESIKRLQSSEASDYSNALCDFLSLIAVHCMIEVGAGVMSDKMLTNGEYLSNILGLLEDTNL